MPREVSGAGEQAVPPVNAEQAVPPVNAEPAVPPVSAEQAVPPVTHAQPPSAAGEALQARCGLAFTGGARIVPAGLGADGPLVGAAAVWHHHAGAGVLPAGPAVVED